MSLQHVPSFNGIQKSAYWIHQCIFFFFSTIINHYKPGSSIATRILNSDYKLCIFPFICSCLSPQANQVALSFTFLKCYIIPAPPHNCIGWLVWFGNGGVIFILWNQTHMPKSLYLSVPGPPSVSPSHECIPISGNVKGVNHRRNALTENWF